MSYSGGWRGYSSRGSSYSWSFNSSRGRWHQKDWEKDVDNFSKDKLSFRPHNRKLPGYMDNRSGNRFKRDQIRHSQSMTSERRWKIRSDNTQSGLNNPQRNNDKSDGRANVDVDVKHKTRFEEEFPLLGDEEKHDSSRSGRALSSDLSNSSHNLPTGTSAVIVSNSSTSASLEVPATVGSNRIATKLDQHTISASSSSIAPGLSMAETLAQAPCCSDTRSQEAISTERREELTRRQSRALIPMIPSKPRILVNLLFNLVIKGFPYSFILFSTPSSLMCTGNVMVSLCAASWLKFSVDGPKFKTWKQQYQGYSHPPTYSPHAGNTKSDLPRRTYGNSYNAAASRELNGGFSSAEKDSTNPGGKNSRNITSVVMTTTLEKKPTPQSQSRIAFFKNLSRKSSLKNSCADPFSTAIIVPCAAEKSEVVTMNAGDAPSMENEIETSAINSLTENNANASSEYLKFSSNEAENTVLYPEEEEEIAFLRSLGWEESAAEDESLTEEEIRDFVEKCKKL
ncbi:hypothetical protein Lalb_Chr20g0123361 [Lupinus albus]|uniref:Uncharacterized protein n=1 Tax=Lupinus albus TaxID=3870 RepID=A0A6A4NYU5_LUPAL|nr:hypothetical protein Lalb_Chr20g0123361 [Lupinus albus]